MSDLNPLCYRGNWAHASSDRSFRVDRRVSGRLSACIHLGYHSHVTRTQCSHLPHLRPLMPYPCYVFECRTDSSYFTLATTDRHDLFDFRSISHGNASPRVRLSINAFNQQCIDGVVFILSSAPPLAPGHRTIPPLLDLSSSTPLQPHIRCTPP